MTDLPVGWAQATFDQVADVQLGKMLDKVKNKGEPTRYLGNINVRWGAFELSDLAEMRMTAADRDAFAILDGDLLVCEGGEPGRSAVWGSGDTQIAFQKALMRVRGLGGTSVHFLQRFLRHATNTGKLADYFTGTTIKHLPQNALRRVALDLPPLAEQRRIVAKLDALTARTARARADLDRVPALTSGYKQAVLTAAFTGVLTADWRRRAGGLRAVRARRPDEIRSKYRECAAQDFAQPYEVPGAWSWLTLPQLGDLDRGKSKHRPRDDERLFGGEFPFIQTGEVRACDRYVSTYSKTYSKFGLAQSRLWPPETVCITIAANIAETAILRIDACFPDSVVGFSADPDRTLPEYAEYFLRTARDDLAAFAPATAQKNINLDTLASIRAPVAPLPEQVEIVRRIDAAFAEIDRLTAEAAAARRLLDRLDEAILAKAFRGELVPQDPADEPASALLARIAAERAETAKPARGRPRRAA